MTRPQTTTSYAILGLLRLRSWTPYELAKQVQKSLGWFWPRAERKLYDEPKNLVALGLATATEEYTGNRPRTVYAITPAGRRALRGWLGHTPEPPALSVVKLETLPPRPPGRILPGEPADAVKELVRSLREDAKAI